MKRIIFSTMILLMVVEIGQSCDACGASVGANGIGLLTNFRYNNIGIRWFHSPFRSTTAGFGNSEDDFYTMELFARYQINQRLKVNLQQPFRWNLREEGDGTDRQLSGISDTRLSLAYAILNNKELGTQTKLYFEVGTGIKFPTGKYRRNLVGADNLPDNFNIGMGNWAWLLQSNLTLTHQRFGWGNTFSFQKNGASKDDYQFGDLLNISSFVFAQLSKATNWQLTPFAGITYENIADDSFANGNVAHSTGGYGAFFAGGVNTQYENWQVGISWATPFTQSYSDDEVEATSRLSLELSFVF